VSTWADGTSIDRTDISGSLWDNTVGHTPKYSAFLTTVNGTIC
jgi:hypothetical protein